MKRILVMDCETKSFESYKQNLLTKVDAIIGVDELNDAIKDQEIRMISESVMADCPFYEVSKHSWVCEKGINNKAKFGKRSFKNKVRK